MNNIKRLFEILPKKTKSKLYIFLVLLFIATIFELMSISALIPIVEVIVSGKTSINYINEIIDLNFNNYTKKQILIGSLISLVLLFFFKTIYLILFSYWTNRFSQNIFKIFSNQILEKYFNEDYLFFVNHKSSDLTRNIIFETKNISAMIFCYLKIFIELFVFIALGIFILFVDFKTSVILIFFFLLFTSIYYFFTKTTIFKYGLIRQKTSASLLKNLQEIFGTIKDIKLKKSETFFKNIFVKDIKTFNKSAYITNTFQEAPRFLIEFFFLLIIVIIIFLNITGEDAIKSILPLLIVYFAAGLRILPGFVKLNVYLQQIATFKPSLILVHNQLKNPIKNTVLNDNDKLNNNINLGDIICKNINYAYEEKVIFDNLNFQIRENSIFGILGKSGSGKSTLVNILLGLLTPDKGKVLVNNLNINNNLPQWQKGIGYVSQNIFLLDSTLKENIAFGEKIEKINYNNLNQAIENANLANFVENLTNGIDTNIGERGSKISGGQMQRIAIARELYRNPSILILDEATTGLDYENEKKIFDSIKQLKNKMTIIIVSHNKKTIEICDNLLDLNNKI
jgi:ABC-type multidrug transport system fused ATPase/permease subunit